MPGVCIGEETENSYLQWLLEGLSDPDQVLREHYLKSEGLCFVHFRQSLTMTDPRIQSGITFVGNIMEIALEGLRQDLREYAGKLSWSGRNEKMTEDERLSWLRVLRFFAGLKKNP